MIYNREADTLPVYRFIDQNASNLTVNVVILMNAENLFVLVAFEMICVQPADVL